MQRLEKRRSSWSIRCAALRLPELGGCTAVTPLHACRFDLLHVMIDEPNDAMDYQIASHIVGVHMRRDGAFAVPFDMRQLQCYLKYARTFRPEMTVEARPRPAGPACCLIYLCIYSRPCIMHSTASLKGCRGMTQVK